MASILLHLFLCMDFFHNSAFMTGEEDAWIWKVCLPKQGGWKHMLFKVPSNQNYSMILLFYYISPDGIFIFFNEIALVAGSQVGEIRAVSSSDQGLVFSVEIQHGGKGLAQGGMHMVSTRFKGTF